MSYCDMPPSATGGRYCRTFAIDHRHADGHHYCAHHLGVVKRDGSPWPVTIKEAS